MKIISGKQVKPRRVLLYGPHGVGKSSWAAQANRPIFLNIEDGLNDIECERTEKLGAFADVVNAVSWLCSTETDYKWVVIDTLDWLEHLIFRAVAEGVGKKNIEDIGYGKGYKLAVEKWQFLLSGLDMLREHGKGVILLAHAKIEEFDSPEAERYDRYEPDLHQLGSSLVQEWCDEVLFANFRVFTKQEDQGFGKKRTMAIGGKERFIRTNESAAALAKNRLKLPDELSMEFHEYAKHFPTTAAADVVNGNIQGLVSQGSSKKKENANG